MTRECEVIEKPGVLASTGPNAHGTMFPRTHDGRQTQLTALQIGRRGPSFQSDSNQTLKRTASAGSTSTDSA